MDSSLRAGEEGVWWEVMVDMGGLGLGDRLINIEYDDDIFQWQYNIQYVQK